MATRVSGTLGRQRITSRVSTPTEAGYIRSMRAQMDVIGQRMANVIDQVRDVTPEAILAALEPIEKRSLELVPEDTGKLKRSFFKEVRKRNDGLSVIVGYGRYGVPWYAALVHENLNFRHAAGKSAKFLERPMNEMVHVFKAKLMDEVTKRAQIGSAGRTR